MTATRIAGAALSVAALCGVLAGCSASTDGNAPEANSGGTTTPAAGATTPSGGKEGEVGAVADMTNFSCSPDKNGTWSASWDVKNADKDKTFAYRFAVTMTNANGQVLKSKDVAATLKPGETKSVKSGEVASTKDVKGLAVKNIKCFAGVYKKAA